MQGKFHCEMATANNDNIIKVDPQVMGHILTQQLLKHGLSQWKEQGEEAITKELTQLYF